MTEQFDPYRAVMEFHRKFGAAIGDEPHIPDADTVKLRLRLIEEEARELRAAVDEESLVDIADSLADLLYVTYGTAVSFGIDIRPVFEEVHRANMTKDGGPRREDGKVLKPDDWIPPRVGKVLREQTDSPAPDSDSGGL